MNAKEARSLSVKPRKATDISAYVRYIDDRVRLAVERGDLILANPHVGKQAIPPFSLKGDELTDVIIHYTGLGFKWYVDPLDSSVALVW